MWWQAAEYYCTTILSPVPVKRHSGPNFTTQQDESVHDSFVVISASTKLGWAFGRVMNISCVCASCRGSGRSRSQLSKFCPCHRNVCSVPGFSLAPSWLLQAFEEWINGMKDFVFSNKYKLKCKKKKPKSSESWSGLTWLIPFSVEVNVFVREFSST